MTNTAQAAAWDGPEGAKWVRYQDAYDTALGAHARALLDAAAPVEGERVLDIGCGCGTVTRAAARAVNASGYATGADLSTEMLARARELTATEGLANIDFVHADVQTHVFDREYDIAISRFGAMFFDDPASAYANVALALAPGGRLALVVWRPFLDNKWNLVTRDAFLAGRDLAPPVDGTPGPFGLSTTEAIHAALDRAFVDVYAAPQSVPVNVGADVDAGVGFLTRTGNAMTLLEGLDEASKAAGFERLRRGLEQHVTPAGVLLDSAVWVVTARRRAV